MCYQYSMQNEKLNGRLISFEGIEGAGKSTQISKFSEALIKSGANVHNFREPGATLIGEKLRAAILESKSQLNPLTEMYIFLAARNELLQTKIIPLLKDESNIVILDRYIDSSVAYQGMARGLGVKKVLELHNEYPLNLRPCLTFYLKINVATSLQRQSSRGNNKDYFEKENQLFYEKLIDGFDQMARLESQRIKEIDAAQSIDEISKSIWKEWETKNGR